MSSETIEDWVTQGNAASERGNEALAVSLLTRAARAQPSNADILVHLGMAYRRAERYDAARYVLERAVRIGGARPVWARLTLASLLELDRRPEQALMHYSMALLQVRRGNRREPGGPELAGLLEHARNYEKKARRALFEGAFERLAIAAIGSRVQHALAIHLGEMPLRLTDPRQQPGFFYLPDLHTTPYLDHGRFPWLAAAGVALGSCREEIEACLQEAAGANRVTVFQRGVLQYEARLHALHLQRLLNGVPLASVAHHAPDVEILAPQPDARLPAQFGRANSRCWAIFNTSVDAALDTIVGGERRVLGAGCATVIDPSFGVQYANASAATARALAMEVWHPDVNDHERAALAALIATAIDFDMRLQDLT